MKRLIKITCIALVLFTALTLLISCDNKRKDGDPPVFTSDKETVMKLGDYNVKSDFYRYLFLNSKALADKGDESYWQKDRNNVEQIKDEVLTALKEKYAMFTLADRYGVSLSSEDQTNIEATIKQMKTEYGSDFENALEEAYMTKELLRFTLEVEVLNTNVYEHIIAEGSGILKVDDETLKNALKTDFVAAKHILFKFSTEEEKQTQYKLAEQALARIDSGEDFDALISEYSDDTNLSKNKYGYYFTHGEFENDFEYTAFELNVGEHSKIIETKDGYHIVKRVALDDNYVHSQFEILRKQYLTAKYYEMLNDVIADLKPEYLGDYVNITLTTFS